jgi:hypothetical protein
MALEGAGPSAPRYAMRALSAAGSEIRPYRSRIARRFSILPIFHSSTLQESMLRDDLARGAALGGRSFSYLHSREVPDGK